MDSTGSALNQDLDLSKLSEKDKKELQQFIFNESQKARIQQCMSPNPLSLDPQLSLCHLCRGAILEPKFAGHTLMNFAPRKTMLTRLSLAVHSLTEVCWKKCVTGTIRSGKLDRSEESCAQNCVDRFMDANLTIIKHLESMRH